MRFMVPIVCFKMIFTEKKNVQSITCMEVVAHNTTKFYEDRIGKQDTQLTLIPFLNTMVPLEIR